MTEHILYGGDVKPHNKEGWNGTAAERLERRYTPEPNSGCWLWTGPVDPPPRFPYGRLWYRGVTIVAHRAAWMVLRGPIPAGLNVLHKCDNPYCVNPDHLFLGTSKQNTADMIAKRRDIWRNQKGENNHGRKITAAQARAIFLDPRPQEKIGKDYGLTQTAVGHIKRGITWREVNGFN